MISSASIGVIVSHGHLESAMILGAQVDAADDELTALTWMDRNCWLVACENASNPQAAVNNTGFRVSRKNSRPDNQ